MSKLDLLNPTNSTVIFIDFQPQMTFGVASMDRQTLMNNVILLAKAARIFRVPTILTRSRPRASQATCGRSSWTSSLTTTSSSGAP